MTDRSPGGLWGFVVSHAVAVTMSFLAVLVFGFVGYLRLPIELMPDISYPAITVRTAWEGAAPQEVENRVSQPIEEALATLDGLVNLQSRSRAGSADVVLGFDWGTDMAAASQAIRENLQTTRLPDTADRPLILRYDPSLEPILRLALSSDTAGADPAVLARLRRVAEDEIKRELEAMSGIAAVRVRGGFEREVRIAVREDWLIARQLTLSDVENTLSAENINIAGGTVLEGDTEYLVRTLNEYGSVDELRDVRIRRSDGVVVPLTDVAVIDDGHKEREVLSRLDGKESVELEVFKEAGANIVEVADRVRVVLHGDGTPVEMGGTEGLTLPDGMDLVVLDDQAAFIAAAVGNLRSTALLGGLFAVLVLYLFLRDWRSTLIIGLAIPVSVVIGFAPLYLGGISLNLMSLGGLALGVGMLVDNAVVVLESIQRYLEAGEDRPTAAANGTADVGAAVVASTLTTVAVFAPIAFVEGVAGELFGDLALAVVSSLLASLAVALLLVPTLAGLSIELPAVDRLAGLVAPDADDGAGLFTRGRRMVTGPPTAQARESLAWMRGRAVRWLAAPYVLFRFVVVVLARATLVTTVLTTATGVRLFLRALRLVGWLPLRLADLAGRAFQAVFTGLAGLYGRFLDAALSHGPLLALSSGGLFVLAVLLFPLLGTELIPEVHQGRFRVDLALPVGTPLSRTERVSAEAEAQILAHPNVRTTYATVGSDRTADASAEEGENTARIRVELEGSGSLASLEDRVMEDLRRTLDDTGDVTLTRPSLFSVATPVEVVLFGQDLDTLREVGDRVVERLSAVDGLADVRSSLADGHPEIRIVYDRSRLHRLGLDPATVAGNVRDKVQGTVPTALRQGIERVDLRVQLVEPNRDTLDDLRRININPALQPVIPLDAAAEFVEAIGPSEIRRVDQQRAVVVSANLADFDLGSAGSDIAAVLEQLELPDSITWRVAGQSSEMSQSLGSLQFALGLAVFLVYVIMASTFENLAHPFVILFSIPLALVGVVPVLLVTGQSISVVVFIGLIVLAGVVVNNAIVLVDTINRRRVEGVEAREAVRQAGRQRLRPILITTATTVLGLLPLSLGIGAGAEIQQPLAITVIGGLISSTVLTLVVIPVVYTLLANVLHPPQPDPS